jgi:hypothetical protein
MFIASVGSMGQAKIGWWSNCDGSVTERSRAPKNFKIETNAAEWRRNIPGRGGADCGFGQATSGKDQSKRQRTERYGHYSMEEPGQLELPLELLVDPSLPLSASPPPPPPSPATSVSSQASSTTSSDDEVINV